MSYKRKEGKMKFDISTPPVASENTGEYLERLSSWLYKLSERLNVTLSNLGKDNFSESVGNKLFGKEDNDDNL